MKIEKTREFTSDEKKLTKKYKSFPDDIQNFIKSYLQIYFSVENKEKVPANVALKIEGFCAEKYDCYKVKHFACKYLKSKGVKSGIRLIFIHFKEENKLLFVEAYHKNNKENEDKKRLRIYTNANNFFPH